MQVNKHCTICNETKAAEEFHRNRTTRDGLASYCRVCTNRRSNARYHTPEGQRKSKDWLLRRSFGLGELEYQSLLLSQGGRCAVCGAKPKPNRRLAVDHNHDDGTIRGLLCDKRNLGIGCFGDSPVLLRKAAVYVVQSS